MESNGSQETEINPISARAALRNGPDGMESEESSGLSSWTRPSRGLRQRITRAAPVGVEKDGVPRVARTSDRLFLDRTKDQNSVCGLHQSMVQDGDRHS